MTSPTGLPREIQIEQKLDTLHLRRVVVDRLISLLEAYQEVMAGKPLSALTVAPQTRAAQR